MFGLGTTEILLIVGAGVVIFGAKKLPEMGAAIGKGLKNFKKAVESSDEPAAETPPSSSPRAQKSASTSDTPKA